MQAAQKKGLSLGFRVGIIIISGTFIISMISAYYSGLIYQKIIMNEFKQRITTLGDNVGQLISEHLAQLKTSKKESELSHALSQVKSVIDAAVIRKDIKFVIVRQAEKLILQNNPAGVTDADIGRARETGDKFGINFLYEIQKNKKKLHFIKIAVEYAGTDSATFQTEQAGEVLFGFDMENINRSVNSAKFYAIMAGLAGALLISLILMAYIYLNVLRPVRVIAEMSQKISNGEIDGKIEGGKGTDEIAVLTRSFSAMAAYITEISDVLEKLSAGEIAGSFEPKSDKDVLGKSLSGMLRYIKDVSGVLGQIARGDLTNTHTAKSELDVLGQSCEQMTLSLKKLVKDIKEQSLNIGDSSNQLSSISSQSRATITQLSDVISNISHATGESARNSQEASLLSVSAENTAREGGRIMEGLLAAMQSLGAELERSTRSMEKLAGHSGDIKNMVVVVKSIADETKLLSLNAAIEAARAGESGRGFAIVADEIGKLSELSDKQAAKISERIKAIRSDIAEAITIAGNESSKIQESTELTAQANAMFSKIVTSVDASAAQMESVAAASQEIAASSEEAAASSEEQTASMEELNLMITNYSKASEVLNDAVNKFKV